MPATDDFAGVTLGSSGPFVRAEAVTPSDTVDLQYVSRALWIGTAGNVRATTQGGDTVTLAGAQSGQIIPGRFTRIWATSTTATGIVSVR